MQTNISPRSITVAACIGAVVAIACLSAAQAADPKPPATKGATLLGGALPGGAVISAKSVAVAPITGGASVAAPIAPDGSFRITGLKSGSYQLVLRTVTVPKQTQGATFGEKVQAGMASAGNAVATGSSARTADMPNRISINVTTPKQTSVAEIDGAPIEVEVGLDGTLTGRVSAP